MWRHLLVYNPLIGLTLVQTSMDPPLTRSFSITAVQAIIFLAPLTLNLNLEEDPTINRVEDSIIIWKAICSNKILERTTIILFLNKMDVLASALEGGLQVHDYVTSYGNLPNDVPSVAKCMSFPPCTKPVSQPALLQTSGINSRGTMYACLHPTREPSHSIFTEKVIAQTSTVLLARNISNCMPVELVHSFSNVLLFAAGHRCYKCNPFRRSRGHPSRPVNGNKCDLDLTVWLVGSFDATFQIFTVIFS